MMQQRYNLYQTPFNDGFPNGNDTDEQRFIWIEPGQLIQWADSMILTGEVVSKIDTNYKFEVYMKFVHPHNWDSWSVQDRGYLAQLPAAAAVADTAHVNWTYWVIDPVSRLIGRDSLEGDVLHLSHAPQDTTKGFQLGYGANDKDGEYGFGGWFWYEGTMNGQPYASQGDVNADLSGCIEDVCNPNLPTIVNGFTAFGVQDEYAQLSWGTVIEGEASFVIVERSVDGQLFEQVAVVDGTTSMEPENYLYEDTDTEGSGTYFYRLKVVRADGSYVYTQVVQVSMDALGESLYLAYPNPAQQSFQVKAIRPLEGDHQIRLYDAKGTQVYGRTVSDFSREQQIDVSRLTKGLYYLQIHKPDGEQVIHRISIHP